MMLDQLGVYIWKMYLVLMAAVQPLVEIFWNKWVFEMMWKRSLFAHKTREIIVHCNFFLFYGLVGLHVVYVCVLEW